MEDVWFNGFVDAEAAEEEEEGGRGPPLVVEEGGGMLLLLGPASSPCGSVAPAAAALDRWTLSSSWSISSNWFVCFGCLWVCDWVGELVESCVLTRLGCSIRRRGARWCGDGWTRGKREWVGRSKGRMRGLRGVVECA